jgi:predicted nucleic acid-binding protein
MQAVLLDTDVFSFIFKRDTRAAEYASHLAGVQPCLCFQSVAELRLWALLRNWGERRRTNLEISIARCLILPFDDGISRRWAEVNSHRLRVGRPIQCGDAWIAAAALQHGIPLLSHNIGDYADIPGLQIAGHGGPSRP